MSVERPCCYRTSVSPRPLRQLSVIIEPAAAGLDPVTSHPGVGAKALIRHQTRFPLKHPPPLRYLLDVGWKIGKGWVGLYRRHWSGSITLRRYCSCQHSENQQTVESQITNHDRNSSPEGYNALHPDMSKDLVYPFRNTGSRQSVGEGLRLKGCAEPSTTC